MKIGLDLRMAGGGSGIGRYIGELSHEILKQNRDNQFVLFFNILTPELRQEYEGYGWKMVETKIGHYSLKEQLILPSILLKEKLDLVHFPHFNVPMFYRKPFVVTIHDLTHTLIPGKKKSHIFHRLAYRAVFANAVRSSQKIIAVSRSTKQQILDYYKISESKIAVVYEGFNALYKMIDKDDAFEKVSKKFGITKPFLLYVGVWRRYKNLPMLAKAFDELKKQGLDIELVLAGEPDSFYPEIPAEIFSIENKASIRAVGRVSDEDLSLLYNASVLFVLPSHMEGFGLTALEAAACGVPVACSDIPTLREIMGQGAVYFDPNNLDNMVDVLGEMLNNPKQLEDMANLSLSRSKHFSWKQAGVETVQVYKETLL
jgi:glycosyltransferase involved in cell wall biosynthesis